jgi:hypothetical protein
MTWAPVILRALHYPWHSPLDRQLMNALVLLFTMLRAITKVRPLPAPFQVADTDNFGVDRASGGDRSDILDNSLDWRRAISAQVSDRLSYYRR